ncbi:MAG: adenylate/guanylate cyclase domain-containing protein [Fimbriimonadaceae bacterium]|nr:adenylate/guanylate cyclase domain-containing protein [Fimbriimonadaceae bacterium]
MSTTDSNPPKRTLSAIAFTDAVGFSAQANQNEEPALDALKRDLDLIRETAGRFDGQVVKGTGDGLMLRFDSAVQAVECALDVQRRFAERTEPGYSHRIGIHLGDVLVTDDDALGDGVNIASRLQQVALPGGICISQTVYDVVKSRIVPLHVVPMGAQQLKNIESPIQAYQITGDGEVATRVPTKTRARSEHSSRRLIVWVSLLIVAIAASQVYVIRNLLNRPPVREIIRTVPVPTPTVSAPPNVPSDADPDGGTKAPDAASPASTNAPRVPDPADAAKESTSKGIGEALEMTRNIKDLTRRFAQIEGLDLDKLDETGDLPPEAKERIMRLVGEATELRGAMPEYREARDRFMPVYDFAGFVAWLNERPKVKETTIGRGLIARLAQLEDLRVWLAERLAEVTADSPLAVETPSESLEVWGDGGRVAVRKSGATTLVEWAALEPYRFYAIGRELIDRNGRRPDSLRQTRALDVFRREYDLKGVTPPQGRPASRVSVERESDPPKRPSQTPPPPGS